MIVYVHQETGGEVWGVSLRVYTAFTQRIHFMGSKNNLKYGFENHCILKEVKYVIISFYISMNTPNICKLASIADKLDACREFLKKQHRQYGYSYDGLSGIVRDQRGPPMSGIINLSELKACSIRSS